MTTYPTIQRYDNTASLSFGDWLLIPDASTNNRLFAFKSGGISAPTAGIYRFNATSGAQTGFAAMSALFPGNNAVSLRTPLTLTYSGDIVWSPSGDVDFATGNYALVNGTTLTLNALLAGTGTNVPTSANLAPVRVGGIDFVMVGTGSENQAPYISVLEAHGTTLQFAGHQFNTDEHNSNVGATVDGSGNAYTVAFAIPGNIGLYKTVITAAAAGYNVASWPGSPNSHISTTKLGTIAPSAIDAGWTQYSTVTGPVYDAADGNVIFFVTRGGGTGAAAYMVKASTVDASIVWKTATGLVGSGSGVNGTLYIIDHNVLYSVNTTTGAITTVDTFDPANGILSTHSQWDASTNSVWGQIVYNGTTTPPPYPVTGTAPNANAGEWGRIMTAAAPTPPAPPPPTPQVSTVRAWTFTLDGHWFYVLDLGAEGTFVYDVDTQQWAKWYTNSTSPNWNVANGVMWGNRIVGGDLSQPFVWEVDPGETQDNANQPGGSAADITHVATGGLISRTRTYTSLAELRISASAGQLDDSGGATLTMQFSDDQGQTWQTFTLALTESDFTTEIVFRSLGAFAAPGRIFQISDVGGLIRIDGVDAMIEDFDNEKQPAERG